MGRQGHFSRGRKYLTAGARARFDAKASPKVSSEKKKRSFPKNLRLLAGLRADQMVPPFGTEGRPAVPERWNRHNIAAFIRQCPSKALVDTRDQRQQRTALHASVIFGLPKEAAELVKAGADVNVCDKSLFSPLARAVRQRNLELIELLLRAGAKADEKTLQSAWDPYIVRLLLLHGASFPPSQIASLAYSIPITTVLIETERMDCIPDSLSWIIENDLWEAIKRIALLTSFSFEQSKEHHVPLLSSTVCSLVYAAAELDDSPINCFTTLIRMGVTLTPKQYHQLNVLPRRQQRRTLATIALAMNLPEDLMRLSCMDLLAEERALPLVERRVALRKLTLVHPLKLL